MINSLNRLLVQLFVCFVLFSSLDATAEKPHPSDIPSINDLVERPSMLNLTHVSFTFSGIVSSEEGDKYHFYFYMQRMNDELISRITLMDISNKQLIYHYSEKGNINSNDLNHWETEKAFLRYHPITDSVILGYRQDGKLGFNFKIDLMHASSDKPLIHRLRQGLLVLIKEVKHVNGHIQLPNAPHDLFVEGKKIWVREMRFNDLIGKHVLEGILCRFSAGEGLYSFILKENDAFQGALSGLVSSDGQNLPISQFIEVIQQKNPHDWVIKMKYPNSRYSFSSLITDEKIAPFLKEGMVTGTKKGICSIDFNEMSAN